MLARVGEAGVVTAGLQDIEVAGDNSVKGLSETGRSMGSERVGMRCLEKLLVGV